MKFWAIWRTNGDYFLAPKHATKESATQEAARLCELEDRDYYVMEVSGVVGKRILNGITETKYFFPNESPNKVWNAVDIPKDLK